MTRYWVLIGLAALAGCARSGSELVPEPVSAAAVASIDYETGPCFGVCPVYRISVSADGKGLFVGMRHTQVTGERAFTVTPGQYRAFAAALAPYRPSIGDRVYAMGNANCTQAATDMPSVDIHWATPRRQRQRLYFYYGCDMEKNAKMAEDLGNAIEALPPLDALIGARP